MKHEPSPEIGIDEAVLSRINLRLSKNHRIQLKQYAKGCNHIMNPLRKIIRIV